MSDIERSLRAMVATKQLEIDKLKRKIKEMEDKYNNIKNAIENEIKERGLDDNQNRQRDTSDRKKNKRTKPSNISDK